MAKTRGIGLLCGESCIILTSTVLVTDGQTDVREIAYSALYIYCRALIWLRQPMRIYLKDNLAKFHPDLMWKDRAFRQKNTKMSSDMRSCSYSRYPSVDPGNTLSTRMSHNVRFFTCALPVSECFSCLIVTLTWPLTIECSMPADRWAFQRVSPV